MLKLNEIQKFIKDRSESLAEEHKELYFEALDNPASEMHYMIYELNRKYIENILNAVNDLIDLKLISTKQIQKCFLPEKNEDNKNEKK